MIPPAPPVRGVVLDFHSTLVDSQDPAAWVAAGLTRARAAGAVLDLDPPAAAALAERLRQVWVHAHELDPASDRDLDPAAHRRVFLDVMALAPAVEPALAAGLYDTMVDQWVAYDDARPLLEALRERGVRVVVLSNIGLDIRGCLAANGLDALVDGVVLSYEVGQVKPAAAVFEAALGVLGLPAAEVLMVGDSPRDDVGGAVLGIRTLVLPPTHGPVHGLELVQRLVGA